MTDSGTNMTDLTTIDYSSYYDENFSNFSPCSYAGFKDFGKVFLPTLYGLVFLLGFVGNGLVVCVLVKHRNQTNLTDICLFNLALSDLLFVLTLPFYAHASMINEWVFQDFMCRFLSTCHTIGFFSSIFFMVAMTLDRYVVVMHAVKVARYRTLRAGFALSVVVWLLSFGVSLPAFIFSRVTVEETLRNQCTFSPENKDWEIYNNLAINIMGLLIPSLVMIVCYCRIIPRLVNMRTAKKHRVVKLIISIMVVFFLFWAPYNISLFLKFLQSENKLPNNCKFDGNLRLSVAVTEAIAYTHCCLNPIIYAFVGQKFMKRAMQLLSKWVPWLHFPFARDFSDSSYRKSSVVSRSSDVTSTLIM
ncbi:C-C chemokine receptor type 1 isoform X2 [Lates calcarifer]|uniref:C-C chemokine receptor type 1 isoform X2 n=1 Tax=Lates calcarifer TaxID=8187 RepID=A0A4W6ELF3_LATCA|nr:C-C chemokine receptor type 1 isoform X2 [Lates calcarifer]